LTTRTPERFSWRRPVRAPYCCWTLPKRVRDCLPYSKPAQRRRGTGLVVESSSRSIRSRAIR
jgi:hypothetical protein